MGKTTKSNAFKNAMIMVSVLFTAANAAAQVQTVTGELSISDISDGQETVLTVRYGAVDSEGAMVYAPGFGMRAHFDSSSLEIGNASSRTVGSQGLQVKEDVSDFDNDPTTDKFLLIVWADTSPEQHGWPAYIERYTSDPDADNYLDCVNVDEDGACLATYIELPARIFTSSFTALSGFNGANINFTFSSVPSGYTVTASTTTTSSVVPVVPVNNYGGGGGCTVGTGQSDLSLILLMLTTLMLMARRRLINI